MIIASYTATTNTHLTSASNFIGANEHGEQGPSTHRRKWRKMGRFSLYGY